MAMQKGLLSAYFYQIAMNGTRLGLFDSLKRIGEKSFLKEYGTVLNVASGATSGVIGAFVGSPFFLIKTRLQSAGGLVGYQHAPSGLFSGLYSIFKDGGVPGLWRGATASMLRTMVGSAFQLTTYDVCKQKIAASCKNLAPSGTIGHSTLSFPFFLFFYIGSRQLFKPDLCARDCEYDLWRGRGPRHEPL